MAPSERFELPTEDLLNSNMNKCTFCEALTLNPKFCGKSCAAKFNNANRNSRSKESRLRTSNAMSGRKNPSAKNPELQPRWCGIRFHNCSNCGKHMTNPKRNTCSKSCLDNIRSKNGTLKKRISYRGFVFQSSWEVRIAEFLDQHDIKWTQPKKRLLWKDSINRKTRTYLPDFYLEEYDVFIDVKNPFKQKTDADKIKHLKEQFNLFVGDLESTYDYLARLAGLEPACVH